MRTKTNSIDIVAKHKRKKQQTNQSEKQAGKSEKTTQKQTNKVKKKKSNQKLSTMNSQGQKKSQFKYSNEK